MIDKRFEGESLSGEELRGLLGGDDFPHDLPDDSPQESAAPVMAHVLLVSRRKDDITLIRSRLETYGVVVTVVRNPFTALDQLRRARYEGVISDLDLWANEGALLLGRVPQADGASVLFLGAGGVEEPARLEKRLVKSGAWGMLSRPLEPNSLESKVQAFVARCLATREKTEAPGARAGAPLGGDASPAADLLLPSISGGDALDCGNSPDSVTPDSASADSTSREGVGAITGEVAWLRFFFHVGKDLRREPGEGSPLRSIARSAREHLQPRAVSIVVDDDGDLTAFVVGGAGDDPSGRDTGELLAELAAAGKDAGAPDSITVRTGQVGHLKSLTLLGLPPEVCAAAQPFLADLQDLLLHVPEIPCL